MSERLRGSLESLDSDEEVESILSDIRFLRCLFPLIQYFHAGSDNDAILPSPAKGHWAKQKFLQQRFVPLDKIEQRGFELLAKDSGEADLDEFFVSLDSFIRKLEIQPLGDVAELEGGAPVNLEHIYRDKESTKLPWHQLAHYIRSGDIPWEKSGGVGIPRIRSTKVRLDPKSSNEIPDHAAVLSSDLLVTLRGTVGRVARFESMPDDIILGGDAAAQQSRIFASRDIGIVRAHNRELENLIAQLLRTPVYRVWMQGHARGNVIRHLSLKDLRAVRLPLLSKSLMLSVTSHFQDGGNLETLETWLDDFSRGRQSKRLLVDAREVRDFADADTDTVVSETGRKLLQNVVHRVQQEISSTAPDEDVNSFMDWLKEFTSSSEALLRILSISSNLGKFSALQGWRLAHLGAQNAFHKAYAKLRNQSYHFGKREKMESDIHQLLVLRAEGNVRPSAPSLEDRLQRTPRRSRYRWEHSCLRSALGRSGTNRQHSSDR